MNHNAECMNCGGPLTTSGSCPGCDSPKPVCPACDDLGYVPDGSGDHDPCPECVLPAFIPTRLGSTQEPWTHVAIALLVVVCVSLLVVIGMMAKELSNLREDRDNAVSELNAIRTTTIWNGQLEL